MTDLKKAVSARTAVRSYAADKPKEEMVGTDAHQDEADGLSLAAIHLANKYNHDPENPDFLDELDALHGHDDEDERAFSTSLTPEAFHAGMTLQYSKSNPRVRRWVRINAQKNVKQATRRYLSTAAGAHVGGVVGHNGGRMLAVSALGKHIGVDKAWKMGSKVGEFAGAAAGSMAVNGLYAAHRRELKLNRHDPGASAITHEHYLKHHGAFVKQQAEKHNLPPRTIAHALSYHALAEHNRQRRTLGSDVWKRGSNEDYHAKLARKAKTNFLVGAEASKYK